MSDPILTKTCSKCQETKPVSDFSKDKTRKDGVYSYCKTCVSIYSAKYRKENKTKETRRHKKYRKNNHEKIRESNKKWQQANKDKVKSYSKKYSETHKEKERERWRKYNETHPEERKELRKNYYETHKEERQKYCREYNRAHRFERREYIRKYYKTKAGKNASIKAHQKRKALKLNATVEDFNPFEIFKRDNYICQLCGCKTRPEYKDHHHPKYPNLDHIIPLNKGGDHSRLNTQCLCYKCNVTKRDRTDFGDQLRLFG